MVDDLRHLHSGARPGLWDEAVERQGPPYFIFTLAPPLQTEAPKSQITAVLPMLAPEQGFEYSLKQPFFVTVFVFNST